MNVKEFLDKIGVSQEDFAVFTGIPRPRIAAWIKYRKDTPPKVEDANIYQLAVRNLSELQQEDAQNMVKNYRIFLNNIISKAEYDNLIKNGIPPSQQTHQYSHTHQPDILSGSEYTPGKMEDLLPQITFSKLEEIEMRMISYTLANLLTSHNKSSISADREFRIDQCILDAHVYYSKKLSNSQI